MNAQPTVRVLRGFAAIVAGLTWGLLSGCGGGTISGSPVDTTPDVRDTAETTPSTEIRDVAQTDATACTTHADCAAAFADLGACQQAICETVLGTCVRVDLPDGTACSGDPCMEDQSCQAGQCVGGKARDCDDGNECTEDSCTAADSACRHVARNDQPCNDQDPCTVDDRCAGDLCEAGAPFDCDDANPCTDDFCDSETGCTWLNNTNPCNDGQACTQNDRCIDGGCLAGEWLECADDGDRCNGVPTCDDGTCVVDEQSAIVCDPSTDTACAQATCLPESGACVLLALPDATPCDDGDMCTLGEFCLAGQCQAADHLHCDDGNPCTDESCQPLSGCVATNNQEPCYDENPCTTDDSCVQGQCHGGANVCPCAADAVCSAYEDDDLCNGTLVCGANGCEVDPQTIVACPPSDSPCERSICEPHTGACVVQAVTDGVPCDDEDHCTLGDACHDGACAGGLVLDCDDDNPCTTDTCDPQDGCHHEDQDGAACEDGNPCTVADTCQQSRCVPGPNDCSCLQDDDCAAHDDDDRCNGTLTCVAGICMVDQATVVVCDPSQDTLCSKNRCNPENGLCVISHEADGLPCSDDNLCTVDPTCDNGMCVHLAILVCDDGNPCTDDDCEPTQGCRNQPNDVDCTDGNPCTDGDRCAAGACVPGSFVCDCVTDADCPDDQDLCNGVYRCVAGMCQFAPETVVVCDPGDNTACRLNSCVPVSGDCMLQAVADGTACNDGDVCTLAEACQAGTCLSDTDLDCDDDNPCTDDACNPQSGCVYSTNQGACDDGNPCTLQDICDEGQCVGTALRDCDDGQLCTLDYCDPAADGCQHVNLDVACDDGQPCTTNDMCSQGQCVGGPAPQCDDGDPCTDDQCQDGVGCTTVANTAPCSDQNACTTNDHCSNRVCVGGQPPNCNDSNPCTSDSCNPTSGCSHAPMLGAACNDANACTVVDTCNAAGQCTGAGAPNCNDGNVCTDDTCDPQQGCRHTNNTSVCNDGNPCTSGDFCGGGQCHAGPTMVCTPCATSADCTAWEDGDRCNGLLHCVNQRCEVDPQTVVTCNPGINTDCRVNTCVPASGQCQLQARPDQTLCNDQDLCTTNDHCTQGICDGSDLTCTDGNPCTTDGCLPASGCAFTPNTLGCNDNNACTQADVCSNGQCHGQAVDCDDSNLCTSDSCVPASGCRHTANTLLCDDLNACTVGDHCSEGLCSGGGSLTCNDGNVCTNDHCSPESGCVYSNNTAPCDDGNRCTANDTCGNGLCSGSAVVCDDGLACTYDACNGLTGQCVFVAQNDWCDDSNDCTVDTCDPLAGCTVSDECCNAPIELACGQSLSSDTTGAANRISAYSCTGWSEVGPDHLYHLNLPQNTAIRALLSGLTSGDLDVLVLETEAGGACDPGHCAAAGDLMVSMIAEVESGRDYYVVVDGNNGASGPYTLTLLCGNAEVCNNSQDDDIDGLTDCHDPDCSNAAACPELCDNNQDDNADGLVDCGDPQCAGAPTCIEQCDNGIDDDQDGFTDCLDEDCQYDAACPIACAGTPVQLVCGHEYPIDTVHAPTGDAIDSYACEPTWDESGPEAVFAYTPTADITVLFEELAPVQDNLDLFLLTPTCAHTDCLGGRTNSLWVDVVADETFYFVVDGYEGFAGTTTVRFRCAEPEVCDDGTDNDLDASTDCADSDCAAEPACVPTVEPLCDDGVDNDGDGQTDCADDDCRVNSACASCQEDSLEDNDTLATAYPNGPASNEYFDLAVLAGDDDWFAIELCAGAYLDVFAHFFHADGDIDLYLQSSAGVLLASSYSVDDDEALTYTAVTAQTVYVRVNLYDGICTLFDLYLSVDDQACPASEICDNDVDDDDDDLIDCSDSEDCGLDPACHEICDNSQDDDGDTLSDCADPDCFDATACDHNWDFEDWSSTDPPVGFTKNPTTLFAAARSGSIVNSSLSSAALTWTTPDNRDLISAFRPAAVAQTTYTFHTWWYDNDPRGRGRQAMAFYNSAGTMIGTSAYSNDYTVDASSWKEFLFAQTAPALTASVGPFVRVYDVPPGFTTATVYTDDWAITVPVTFLVTDGALDSGAVLVAGHPGQTMTLYAAVNNAGVLYAATDHAAQGTSDHFLFVWIGGPGSVGVALPWAKSGQVAGPAGGGALFALIQEESNGYCHWMRWNTATSQWLEAATTCNQNGSSPYLEGSLNLPSVLGLASSADVPGLWAFAVAPYGSTDDGLLLPAYQQPPTADSDGNLGAGETTGWHRAKLLTGKILTH